LLSQASWKKCKGESGIGFGSTKTWRLSERRLMMGKERIEWVMSGLSYYNLTAREDQFVKSVKQDFNQKNVLT
jgi:hypothetical protein